MTQLSPEFVQWCREYVASLDAKTAAPAIPPGLDPLAAAYVMRLICDGRRAGIARKEGDEARACFATESIAELRQLLSRYKLCADTCYNIGYRSA